MSVTLNGFLEVSWSTKRALAGQRDADASVLLSCWAGGSTRQSVLAGHVYHTGTLCDVSDVDSTCCCSAVWLLFWGA